MVQTRPINLTFNWLSIEVRNCVVGYVLFNAPPGARLTRSRYSPLAVRSSGSRGHELLFASIVLDIGFAISGIGV